jgi:hypothetical protein
MEEIDQNESTPSSANTDPLVVPELNYETYEPPKPVGRRPWWVYGVVGLYVLLLVGFLEIPVFFPDWIFSTTEVEQHIFAACCVGVLFLCGVSLLVIPVRVVRRRPVHRGSIWFPVIGSGLLTGGLFLGAGIAIYELFEWDKNDGTGTIFWSIIIASVFVWIGWSILFAIIAFRRAEDGLGSKLHRLVIVGSILELLIAVPAHIIVRRRDECCAGILTGFGICLGVAVMLVSFGPSVLFLFYRRWNQIKTKHA